MRQHPEQRDDELYMGSIGAWAYDGIGWKTKRLGRVPYLNGKPLAEDSDLRPLFIAASEVEQAIRTEEANPKPDSAWLIDKVYRLMLKERV